jgi:hypothetical protein
MENNTYYFCKDCRFSKMNLVDIVITLGGTLGVDTSMYRCSKAFKPAEHRTDLVIGPIKINAETPYCSVERAHGDCGKNAKNWSPKKKKDLFKMLTKEIKND